MEKKVDAYERQEELFKKNQSKIIQTLKQKGHRFAAISDGELRLSSNSLDVLDLYFQNAARKKSSDYLFMALMPGDKVLLSHNILYLETSLVAIGGLDLDLGGKGLNTPLNLD